MSTLWSRVSLGFCTITFFTVCTEIFADSSPASQPPKPEDVRTLLRLNGSGDTIEQLGPLLATQIVANLHQSIPTLPLSADPVVSSAVDKYVREEEAKHPISDLQIPIYAKYLSSGDVDQLILFYRSPVGKKLASVAPSIAAESALAGQQWARSMAPGLQARVMDVLKTKKFIQ